MGGGAGQVPTSGQPPVLAILCTRIKVSSNSPVHYSYIAQENLTSFRVNDCSV